MRRSKIWLISGITLIIIAWGNIIGYGQVTVKIPSITTIPDTTVQLPVLVSELTSLGILSYQFKVLYDSMIATATGVTIENTLTAAWGSTAINLEPAGQMVVGAFGIHELAGSDTLIKLNFQIIAGPGDSATISFEYFLFNNGTPRVITEDGVIKIAPLARVRDARRANLPATPRLIRHYPEPLCDHASFMVLENHERLATIEIRNLLGQRIREFTIVSHGQPQLSFDWDARDGQGQIVAPGIYFCVARQSGGVIGVDKMTVIR